MKELIIIGAGGFGREVYDTILELNEIKPVYNVIGFADDNEELWEKKINGLTCFGGIEKLLKIAMEKEIYAVIAIGTAKTKESISNKLEGAVKWVNIIHPECNVSRFAEIGHGNILQRQVTIGPNSKIGNHCSINAYSGLGHDSTLGDYSSIMAHCEITGCVRVGKSVFMGSGSRIVNNVVVGDRAFICAGTIVFKDVNAGNKIFGYPGKVIG